MTTSSGDALLDLLRQAVDNPEAVLAAAREWVVLAREPATVGVRFEEPPDEDDRLRLDALADVAERIADAIECMSTDELRAEIARREEWQV